MMKKITSMVILLIMIFSFTTVVAEELEENNDSVELSLQESIDRMMEVSAQGKAAEINLKSARAVAKGNKESLDEVKGSMEVSGVLSATLPSAYDKALLELIRDFANEQGQLNYEAEVNALLIDTREQYFSHLQLLEAVEIQREGTAIEEKTYEETKEKYELGLVTLNDLMAAELSLEETRSSLQGYENNLKLSEMSLNNFLGYELEQQIELVDSLEPLEMPNFLLDEVVAIAMENNNDIRGAEYNLDLQSFQLDAYELRYSKSSSRYMNQEVAFLRAEQGVKTARNGIVIDIYNRYMTMMQSNDAISIAQKSVANAESQLASAQLSYDLGLGTLLQVQQAQLNYTNKQMALSQAILDYNLAVDRFAVMATPGTNTVPLQ